MFTGIITDIGEIAGLETTPGDGRIVIVDSSYDAGGIAIGASIACAGICLTVTDLAKKAGGSRFTVEASAETVNRTTLGTWQVGHRLNLERALKIGDELGGHIVTGHVDGTAMVLAKTLEGNSIVFQFQAPKDLAMFIAKKGSITIDGVSLTVNEVSGARFEVNIIPHTASETSLGAAGPGDKVNLEVDLMARYAARLSEARNGAKQ
jgi:riboflavin synthase